MSTEPASPVTVAAALLAVSHAAKPAIETGARLLEKLLGKPCEVAGDLMADKIYYWQWMNRVRMFSRAEKIMDEKKVPAKVVPPGFLLPLTEAVGNVDDEDLQELWAQLLASSVQNDAAQHPLFIRTLQGMNRDDAGVIKKISVAPWEQVAIDSRETVRSIRVVAMGGTESDERDQRSVIRLESIGVVSSEWGGNNAARVSFTTFGAQFAAALGLIDQPISLLMHLRYRS